MTAAELASKLMEFPADSVVYVSTENHTEPLTDISVYASGAISLDGDSETNYYPGRMPPNDRASGSTPD